MVNNQAVKSLKRGNVLPSVARVWLLEKNIPADIQNWINFHHSPLSLMSLDRWEKARNWRSPILSSFYANTYVEEYFRKKQNWELSAWTDLKNPLMRFAISNDQFLNQLAVSVGVLIGKEKIRKIVDRKTILLLKEELGEEALQVALAQKAPLDLVPPKLRLTAWVPSQGTTKILNAAWLLIACAGALLPVGEWKIFLTRLPKSVELAWSQHEFSREDSLMSWNCLQTLVKEMKGEI